MYLRNMATIFVVNKEQILMMKRSKEKLFLPNIWAAIGGHIEKEEMNYPKAAALREIYEEIGFLEKDFQGITLRYILLKRIDDEIRIQYVYVAKTEKNDFQDCTEGSLHWVDKKNIIKRHDHNNPKSA